MAVNQGTILNLLEQACLKLNPDEFIYQFMDAYGFPKSTVTRLRNSDDDRNVGEGSDIGVKKKLYFKRVSQGADVGEAADALKTSDAVTRNDIRFVIATDFKTLVAYDLKADERLEVAIDELHKDYGFFLPLAGYEKAVMYSEHPADLKASEKMGQLFDMIRERNDLTKAEDIHALNVFLTRLLFCFYAEDTGIFAEAQMTSALQLYTKADGSDVDQFFTDLFTVLNLDANAPERQAMPSHFQAFPFVNGGLFAVDEPVPEFGAKARRILLDCGSLDWSQINPDIFGSMFQAVIDPDQRGSLGQHYTSVSNIMKVIQPLFLDELYSELEKSQGNERKLKALLLRLQNIRVFDPACGSGNFLIIAYKELRKLEMEIIDALNATGAQSVMYYSGIRLSQFFGIEIDDFAHEVAILSLWLAEHQMNTAFKAKFGYAEAALPLRESGRIVSGNSLRLCWSDVCSKKNINGELYEVYLCGNPPFLGKGDRTESQTNEMEYVLGDIKGFKSLDYVACWLYKASDFIKGTDFSSAFVSTNSIVQGEQAGILWPSIFDKNIFINFAYRTFTWKNSARSNAGVHVVIIGLSTKALKPRIFLETDKTLRELSASYINPYLLDSKSGPVTSRSTPLCNVSRIIDGNNYTKCGGLILNKTEMDELLEHEPNAKPWIRRFVGADEFLNAKDRWCLWLLDANVDDIEAMPLVKARVEEVKADRLLSGKKETREKASLVPHLFPEIRQPREGRYLLIPRVTSERRLYAPVGYMAASVITSNQVLMIPEAGLFEFGVLSSETHNDWMRTVGGRLKSDYRYSATLVYNTFPWPDASNPQRKAIEALAEEVLLVREDYSGKTLAELYDPDKMPQPLLDAHKALDRAVEKLYRDRPFRDASERLEHLFARYEKLIAAEQSKASAKKITKGIK